MHNLESHPPKKPPLLARRRLLALDRDQLTCLSHEAIPSQASCPTTAQPRLHLAMIDDELITEVFLI